MNPMSIMSRRVCTAHHSASLRVFPRPIIARAQCAPYKTEVGANDQVAEHLLPADFAGRKRRSRLPPQAWLAAQFIWRKALRFSALRNNLCSAALACGEKLLKLMRLRQRQHLLRNKTQNHLRAHRRLILCEVKSHCIACSRSLKGWTASNTVRWRVARRP